MKSQEYFEETLCFEYAVSSYLMPIKVLMYISALRGSSNVSLVDNIFPKLSQSNL